MKKVLMFLFVALSLNVWALEPYGAGSEITPGILIYNIDDDDDYDSGAGIECQYRFWFSEIVGIGGSIGYSNWEINDDSYYLRDETGSYSVQMDGDVSFLFIGPSLLLRPQLNDRVRFVFDAGIKYVVVDSNAKLNYRVSNGYYSIRASEDIDMDDGIIGTVGLNCEFSISNHVSLFVGAGYNFDIEKGDAEVDGEDFGENELKSSMFKTGCSIRI